MSTLGDEIKQRKKVIALRLNVISYSFTYIREF